MGMGIGLIKNGQEGRIEYMYQIPMAEINHETMSNNVEMT